MKSRRNFKTKNKKMFHKLYLEAFTDACDEDKIIVTIETLTVLFVLECVERPSNIKVFLIPSGVSRSMMRPLKSIVNRLNLRFYRPTHLL